MKDKAMKLCMMFSNNIFFKLSSEFLGVRGNFENMIIVVNCTHKNAFISALIL